MDCVAFVSTFAVLLMCHVPCVCQATVTAVNISVSLSRDVQEAHVTCTYISSTPVSPRIIINGTTYTEGTLETAGILQYYHLHHCYYDSTMLNTFTIVLCKPRLYVGTMFECNFRLHGGEQVNSGPATLTLAATGVFSRSLCSAENANATCPLNITTTATTTLELLPTETSTTQGSVVVSSLFQPADSTSVLTVTPSPTWSGTQVLPSQNVVAVDIQTGPLAVRVDPVMIVSIVLGIVLLALVALVLLALVLVVRAKKKKCRQNTPTSDYDLPVVNKVPVTKNPSYEPVEVGSSFSSSRGGSRYCKRGSGLRRESYDNVQLKNVAVIPSSCKPLSVAPVKNDYQQPPTASLAAAGNASGVPTAEFHAYEEVELKRSHTVIPIPHPGHTYGNVNPKQEPTGGEKTTTVIFIESDSPEFGTFGPRRATTAACFQGKVKPHTPALLASSAHIATHCKENLPLQPPLGDQADAAENQAPCLDEDSVRNEDVDHDEALDVATGHDESITHDRRSKTSDSGGSACYDYI